MTEKESLTTALYYIHFAKEFMEFFKKSCKQEAKYSARQWVNKLNFIESDIYNALTPRSKQLFQEEIAKGDPLFLSDIGQNLLQMTPEQREMVETLCKGILKGQLVKFEQLESVTE